jgi:hypothetical protein
MGTIFVIVVMLLVLAGLSSRPAEIPSVVVMPALRPRSGTSTAVVFLTILFLIVLLLEMARQSS